MKLTKGKISKLYRKNKQSLKRYKKKETKKNKSFRKNTHVNLRNKSLKNFKGGQDKVDSLNEKKPTGSPNIQDGKNKTAELLSEASDELNDGDNAVDPETLKQEQDVISQVSPELGESPKKESLDIDSYPSDLTQEPLPEPSAQLETTPSNSQNESTELLEKEATTPEQTESTQNPLPDGKSPFLEEGNPEQTSGLKTNEETNPEQTDSTQKALEEIPEVTDNQAAASPFLAEVKTEQEEGAQEQTIAAQTSEETGAQTSEETGAQTSEEMRAQTSDEMGAQSSDETGAQTSEETGAQTNQETGAQSSDETGAQTSEETGAQTNEETGAQTNEETGAQTNEETGAQTSEETGAQISDETGAQTSEETGAQISDETGPKTSEPQESAPSGEGLPENVSVAAKTIIDYAMGSLAKQINSSTISQGVQNPESAFTNMTNTFASQGGRSLKNKIRAKGKKTRKH